MPFKTEADDNLKYYMFLLFFFFSENKAGHFMFIHFMFISEKLHNFGKRYIGKDTAAKFLSDYLSSIATDKAFFFIRKMLISFLFLHANI